MIKNAITITVDSFLNEGVNTSKTTRGIKNDFNRLAEKLGCKARLAGNLKKPKFQMWTGEITHDGYEVVVGES